MRFIQSPLCTVYVTVCVIVIFEFMFSAYGMNMWTGVDKRAAKRERPLKRCLSPCKIFHTWCKNEGKCREKGEDCTWYCECPANCEGFFCEKVVAREFGAAAVQVNVIVQKVEKKDASSFDKSKLVQALAGIMMKKQTREEDKNPSAPDTIDRIDGNDQISVKENMTTTIIINCPTKFNDTGMNISISGNVESDVTNSSLVTPTSDNYNQSDWTEDASNMTNITVNNPQQNVSLTEHVDTTNVSSTESNITAINNSITVISDGKESNSSESQTVTELMQNTSSGTVESTSPQGQQDSDNNITKYVAKEIQSELVKDNITSPGASETLSEIIKRAFETVPVKTVQENTNNQTSKKETTSTSIAKSKVTTAKATTTEMPTTVKITTAEKTTTTTENATTTNKTEAQTTATTPTLTSTPSTTSSTITKSSKVNVTHKATKKSTLPDNKQTSSTTMDVPVKDISISDRKDKTSDGDRLYSARTSIKLTSGANLSHDKMHVILNTSTDSPSIAAGNKNISGQRANITSTESLTTEETITDIPIKKSTKEDIKLPSKGNDTKVKENALEKQSKFSVKTVTEQIEPKLPLKDKGDKFKSTSSRTNTISSLVTSTQERLSSTDNRTISESTTHSAETNTVKVSSTTTHSPSTTVETESKSIDSDGSGYSLSSGQDVTNDISAPKVSSIALRTPNTTGNVRMPYVSDNTHIKFVETTPESKPTTTVTYTTTPTAPTKPSVPSKRDPTTTTSRITPTTNPTVSSTSRSVTSTAQTTTTTAASTTTTKVPTTTTKAHITTTKAPTTTTNTPTTTTNAPTTTTKAPTTTTKAPTTTTKAPIATTKAPTTTTKTPTTTTKAPTTTTKAPTTTTKAPTTTTKAPTTTTTSHATTTKAPTTTKTATTITITPKTTTKSQTTTTKAPATTSKAPTTTTKAPTTTTKAPTTTTKAPTTTSITLTTTTKMSTTSTKVSQTTTKAQPSTVKPSATSHVPITTETLAKTYVETSSSLTELSTGTRSLPADVSRLKTTANTLAESKNKLFVDKKQSAMGLVSPIVKGANTNSGDSKPKKDIDTMSLVSNKLHVPERTNGVMLDNAITDPVERPVAEQGLNNVL